MPAHRVPRVQLICAYEPCGKPFEAMPAEAKRGGVRYCSPQCRQLARQQPRSAKITLLCAYEPCSQPFEVLPWQAEIWKYCSQPCYHTAKSATIDTFAERFWSKVDKTPGHGPWGDCWLWTGATHANGYGNFRATPHKPGNMSAHIVCWFVTAGEWPPDGLFVLHRCDVRACTNPAHLFLGTHLDNVRDMLAKGRGVAQTRPELAREGVRRWRQDHPTNPWAVGDNNWTRRYPERVLRGERNGNSKLTDAQWAEIFALWDTGQWTQSALARKFGLSHQRVGQKIRAHNTASEQ